jgi:hypothetical protein
MWGTVGNTAGQVGGALFQYGMGQTNPADVRFPIHRKQSTFPVRARQFEQRPVNWGGF